MKFVIVTVLIGLLTGCQADLSVMGSQPKVVSNAEPSIFALDRVKASKGDVVTLVGTNLKPGMIVQIAGKMLELKVDSPTSATFIMPESSGDTGLGASFFTKDNKQLGTLALVSNEENVPQTPIMDVDPGVVCSDISYRDAQGHLKTGMRNCAAGAPLCQNDGETTCVTSAAFPAVSRAAVTAQNQRIRAGTTIGGVLGTLNDCAVDGDSGCVAVGPTFAAAITIAAAPKIVVGNTLAGVVGTATAAAAPCTGANQSGCLATPTYKTMDLSTLSGTDLTAANFNATIRTAGNFEFWDSLGSRYSVAGDTNLSAANLKNAVSVFGLTGQYPSVTYPLASDTATADLTSFASQLMSDTAFEYFDSTGARHLAAGDSDLFAENVRSGVLFENLSMTGSMPAILPAAPTTLSTAFIPGPDRVVLDWTNMGASGYIVVARAGAAVTFNPTRNITYTAGSQGADTILYVGNALTYTHTPVTSGVVYYYAVYSYDTNHFYSATAATALHTATFCAGLAGGVWSAVPGDADYGTSDFCVMKYEASNVGSVPTSQVGASSWTSINQPNAQTACKSLGTHYDLISNREWLTVASNMASVASNWSSGVVGTGTLNRGNSQGPGKCPASADDSLAWVDGGCSAIGSGGQNFLYKRNHSLNNGAVVWDLAGNVGEFTSTLIADNNHKPYRSSDGSPQNGWRALNSIDTDFSVLPRIDIAPNHALKSFWNDAWTDVNGIGDYDSSTNGSGNVIRRGEAWGDYEGAGIFSMRMDMDINSAAGWVGFRCVYHP